MTAETTKTTYPSDTEAEYHESTERLANELLAEYTPLQIAIIAAQHMIYVDVLQEGVDSRQSLIETLSMLNDSRNQHIEALQCENEQKISTKNFQEIAKILWKKAKGLNPSKGGIARHRNDPKAQEKSFIFECWQAWKRDPRTYKTKAAFARAMLEKCEHLESNKVIEGWCREWEQSEPS